MEDSRRRGRRTLLLVAALFLLPVALAFALYYGNVWRPAGSSSKGELITPARPLITTGLRQPDGAAAGADVLQGKWSLVYVGDGACDNDCRTSLVYARQSRLALNNEMTRVQIVLLADAHCCEPQIEGHVPGIRMFDASSPDAVSLLEQFPARRARSLFIVDPLGHLMMRFPKNADPQKVKKDLVKVLKASANG